MGGPGVRRAVAAVVLSAAAVACGATGPDAVPSARGADGSAPTAIAGRTSLGPYGTQADDGTSLPKGVTLSAWVPLFAGIELRRGHADEAFALPGVARAQELTAVRIDLTTPGLRFETRPAAGDATPDRPGHRVHTAGASLTQAMRERGEIALAVNGNFFWPCCDPSETTTHVGMTLFGLAIDHGAIVADPREEQQPPGLADRPCAVVAAVPDDAAVGAHALVIDRQNHASIVAASALDPLPPDAQAAVAGGPQPLAPPTDACSADEYPPQRPVPGPALLLDGGSTQATASARPPELVAGRTFVGISADGRYLDIATIDGGDEGGAAFFDEAAWLRLLGATRGLNLDGGGSTTMAMRVAGAAVVPPTLCPADPAAPGVRLLDVPYGYVRSGEAASVPCRERLIGTELGVVVDP